LRAEGLKVTAKAHPNLALVKYWGKVDEELNIPASSSISVNLSGAATTTTVVFVPGAEADSVTIDGQAAPSKAYLRVVKHLDRVRQLAGITTRAKVESWNDFPASAGIASSASAFAALSLAASRAAGLSLTERELSILARKGSGSACRSIPDGFVEFVAGSTDETAYARQLFPPEHWDLRIITVILEGGPKEVPSSEGHRAAQTSPFYAAWLAALPPTLETVRRALAERDLGTLGMAVERQAMAMHAVAMTSSPAGREWLSGIYYWAPGTVALIRAVQDWRRQGLRVYLTIDAGANVHLLCEAPDQGELEGELGRLLPALGGRYLVSRPAVGARIIGEE
jgi:diphosphomevalonate decarboxylase